MKYTILLICCLATLFQVKAQPVQEVAIATVAAEEHSYRIGFGNVSRELITKKESSVLNLKTDQLQNNYGVAIAFESIGNSDIAGDDDQLKAGYAAHLVSKEEQRVGNNAVILFDEEQGKAWIFFGKENKAFLQAKEKNLIVAFNKTAAAAGYYQAMWNLLEQIGKIYQAQPEEVLRKLRKTKETSVKIQSGEDELERNAYDLMEQERYKAAIAAYQEVISYNPKNDRAYYNISWIYATTGESQKAIDMARRALKNVPAAKHADFYRMMGNCYTELEEWAQGEQHLKTATRMNPEDENAWYNLGYNNYRQKKYSAAIGYLRKAFEKGYEKENKPADAWFYMGTSYAELGKNDSALLYYDKAIAQTPFINYYFNKAEALLKLDRKDDALAVCNKGIALYPDSSMMYFKRHQVYSAMDNRAMANVDLKKAYALDPDDADILQDMGVMYRKENNVDKALALYRKAFASSSDKAGLYSNIAGIYSDNKLTHDSAAYYYKKAIEISPRKASLYFNYGNFYKDRKEYRKAIGMYEKAIELDPQLDAPYANIAVVYATLEEYDKVQYYVEKGLEVAPNDFELNANMVSLQMHNKNYKKAIVYINKSLERMPKGVSNFELLHKRGVARQMTGEYNNAVYDYLSILDNMDEDEKKSNGSVYANIGYCYLGLNDLRSSRKYFEQSLKYSREIDPVLGLMMVAYLDEDDAKCRKLQNEAIRLEPALENGMQGIEKLEQDGFFYTDQNKKILRKIFEGR